MTNIELFPKIVFSEGSVKSRDILTKKIVHSESGVATVFLPITAHGDIVTETLKASHQCLLLIGAHSRKEGTPGDQSFHHIWVMISDDVEAFSRDGKVIVVVVRRRRSSSRLLHFDDERRVPICRLGFAHLRH